MADNDFINEDLQRIIIQNEYELKELLEDNDIKRIVQVIVIKENCGNEMKDDLAFCDFEELNSIIVEKNALKNVKSLIIADNPCLRMIKTETGDGGWKSGDSRNTGAFYNTRNITIDSLLLILVVDSIFLSSLLLI